MHGMQAKIRCRHDILSIRQAKIDCLCAHDEGGLPLISTGREGKLGTFSTLSIGIGGMEGGGIFAVTGLTVDVTKGVAPIAFPFAGIVALLK